MNRIEDIELKIGDTIIFDDGTAFIVPCKSIKTIYFHTQKIKRIIRINQDTYNLTTIWEKDNNIKLLMGLDTRETQECIIAIQNKLNELIDEVNKLKE